MKKKNSANLDEQRPAERKKRESIHPNKQTAARRYMVAACLVLFDIISVSASYFLSLWLLHEFQLSDMIETGEFRAWLHFLPFYAFACLVIFCIFHLYQSLWRFASFVEFRRVVIASLVTGVFHGVFISLLFDPMRPAYFVLGTILQFLFVLATRFAYRCARMVRDHKKKRLHRAAASRVMLIGAGAAGNIVLRDMHNAKEINECVCCIIDDNERKWGRSMEGVPIVGGRNDILLNVEKYRIEKIYLTMPSAPAAVKRDILNICKETTCQLKTLPGVFELVTEGGAVNALKDNFI